MRASVLLGHAPINCHGVVAVLAAVWYVYMNRAGPGYDDHGIGRGCWGRTSLSYGACSGCVAELIWQQTTWQLLRSRRRDASHKPTKLFPLVYTATVCTHPRSPVPSHTHCGQLRLGSALARRGAKRGAGPQPNQPCREVYPALPPPSELKDYS